MVFTTKYTKKQPKKVRKFAKGGRVDDSEEDLDDTRRNPLVQRAPDIFESRPTVSSGNKSIIELNNPQLGPTEPEMRERGKEFERRRRRDAR